MASRLISGLICGVASLLQAGCQALEARALSMLHFTATSAGYAGRFRIAHDRWPANVNELDEFMCMAGRAEQFGLARLTCEEVVAFPYRIELQPIGDDLRIRCFESPDTPVCSLKLFAPPTDAHRKIFPALMIRSTLFECRAGAFEAHSRRRRDS